MLTKKYLLKLTGILLVGVIFLPLFFVTAESISNLEVKEKNLPLFSVLRERGSRTQNNTAILFVDSETDSFSLGDTIELNIILDPQGESVNTVSAIIHYPESKLKLLTIDNSDSDFSIFLEKEADEEKGIIKISCIQPFPGIKQKAQISKLIFDPLETGNCKIEFLEDSMVLANDGYGTNILKEAMGNVYSIKTVPSPLISNNDSSIVFDEDNHPIIMPTPLSQAIDVSDSTDSLQVIQIALQKISVSLMLLLTKLQSYVKTLRIPLID